MSTPGSSSFDLLDERIRHFIWNEGWKTLRDAQEAAIPLIVKGDRDVIIAAATAAGKTEAAFFPALTHLMQGGGEGLIVYVSPLKALINDQFQRLERLCEQLNVSVWPWHGDVSGSTKTRFMKKPQGVLLITPESLEATLCNRGTSVGTIFRNTTFFIIDELHAFIGSERGKQLQSLMHRIDALLERRVPRIGLSATLGDMKLASAFLRPGGVDSVAVVESHETSFSLKVLVKGYEEPAVIERPPGSRAKGPSEAEPDAPAEGEPITPSQIAVHLYKALRGSNNLIFPNSRREVESYTHLLSDLCERNMVPNEFWPHHGSLSKEIRTETEAALKQKERPATAICTNTLELGIDIGAVESVAQIGPPPSVASLRQRLGRSGRRPGASAILRGYCVENALAGGGGRSDSLVDVLRLDTLQLAADISLLLERWFEPPRTQGVHLSTLVQQILSVISQYGGATIGQLYGLLCSARAPFEDLSKAEFVELITQLGQEKLLTQDASGTLLHGEVGERFVNHYSFYSAFTTAEEFRVIAGGKSLGSLPVTMMLVPGQYILFAGKTWRVNEIDDKQKAIYVTRGSGGKPPMFEGGTGRTHTKVRQRMREMLESKDVPAYLDETAKRFLAEARLFYAHAGLAHRQVLDQGGQVLLLTWLGDGANEALSRLLALHGFTANAAGPAVEVQKGGQTFEDVVKVLAQAGEHGAPPLAQLLEDAHNLEREKWDWALPPSLLHKAYASLYMDFDEAIVWCKTLVPPAELSASAATENTQTRSEAPGSGHVASHGGDLGSPAAQEDEGPPWSV